MSELINIVNKMWSVEENATIIGQLPSYRRKIKNGMTENEAAKIHAKELLVNDSEDFFASRKEPNTKDEIDTMSQHIKHMDKIAAGERDAIRENEKSWYKVYPRD
jgi:hypothetical protein